MILFTNLQSRTAFSSFLLCLSLYIEIISFTFEKFYSLQKRLPGNLFDLPKASFSISRLHMISSDIVISS